MASIAPSVDFAIRPVLATGIEALNKSRGFLDKLLEAMSDEQMMARPCPGANHAAWVLGHIAWTEDLFLRDCAGREPGMPEGWDALFEYGSEVSDDASVYPSREELISVLHGRRDALLGWLFTLDETAMATPVQGDLSGLAKNFGLIAPTLAFHEGFHAGQLSVARRAAGHARLY